MNKNGMSLASKVSSYGRCKYFASVVSSSGSSTSTGEPPGTAKFTPAIEFTINAPVNGLSHVTFPAPVVLPS